MKKIIVLFVFLIFNFSAYAQGLTCLNKLLPYNRNSGLHQVLKEEWTDGKDVLDVDSAKTALTFLINSKLLCTPGEVEIKIQPVCQAIIADIPQSNTCFTFTNVGYFVISKDMAKNINFIFSKDKTYAEPGP